HTRFSRDWSSDVCSSDLDKIGSGDSIVTGDVGRIKGFSAFRSQYAIKDGGGVYHGLAFTRDAIVLATRRFPAVLPGTGAISEERSEERRVGKAGSSRRSR